jgi:hypothetical protein
MYMAKLLYNEITIQRTQVTIYQCQPRFGDNDYESFGPNQYEDDPRLKPFYEAYIGKNIVLHKSREEPTEAELEFQLREYYSSPLKQVKGFLSSIFS